MERWYGGKEQEREKRYTFEMLIYILKGRRKFVKETCRNVKHRLHKRKKKKGSLLKSLSQ